MLYPIPPTLSDEHAAPLLCAGAIGYRHSSPTWQNDRNSRHQVGFQGILVVSNYLGHCFRLSRVGFPSIAKLSSSRMTISRYQNRLVDCKSRIKDEICQVSFKFCDPRHRNESNGGDMGGPQMPIVRFLDELEFL